MCFCVLAIDCGKSPWEKHILFFLNAYTRSVNCKNLKDEYISCLNKAWDNKGKAKRKEFKYSYFGFSLKTALVQQFQWSPSMRSSSSDKKKRNMF